MAAGLFYGMADCPLADDCPSFDERIEGMGCQHYGNKGGAGGVTTTTCPSTS